MNLYEKDEIQVVQNNTMAYILGTLLVVMVGYVGYIYSTKDMVPKGDLKEKYVKKDDINFDMLPEYIKSRYIESYKYNSEINDLNLQIEQLKTAKNIVSGEPKIVEKIVEVEKVVEIEKIVEVPVEITKEATKEIPAEISKANYKTYRCYDMADGGVYPSQNCIDALSVFLEQNKDAKMFEVIGVVNSKEFVLIDKLKKEEDNQRVENLSKYAQLGLSRKRVIEGTWAIKQYLGLDTNEIGRAHV